jgi:hypothetical protein
MLRVTQGLDRRDLDVYLHLAELYLGKDVKGDALRLLEGARRAFRRKRFLREAIAVEEKILSVAPGRSPSSGFFGGLDESTRPQSGSGKWNRTGPG